MVIVCVCGALAALLVTVPAQAAPPTEKCNPAPKVSSSFCVTYGLDLSSTTAGSPLGFDLSVSDSSDNFTTDTNTWADSATLSLGAVNTTPPGVTPSASMPDGLLIAGGDPCSRPSYADCAGGQGTFAAIVSGTLGVYDGYRQGTFGIKKIVNVASAGPGNRARYQATIDYCLTFVFSCDAGNNFTADITIPEFSAGAGSVTLNFPVHQTLSYSVPPFTVGADGTLKSMALHLPSQTSTLGDGSPAGQTYTPLTVPASCGTADTSADVHSRDARTVSFADSISVTGCPPATDTDPPETSITKGPKKKTKKLKAKFGFESDEPGSSFECKLDEKGFKPCETPFKKKVKAKKHSFEVHAIDPAGNTDPTPATRKWKVKKG